MTPHALRRLVAPCLAAVLCAVPGPSIAQSLADIARKSTATRAEQPKPAKVYTNDNLRTDITPSVAGATPSADAAAADSGAVTATAGSVTDARGEGSTDEAAWRARIGAARDTLERSTAFASALQSQINALTADFINRDDPAQRAQIEQQRLKAVAELERTERDVESNRKAIAAIEDEARKAGVPAGWLR